MNHVTNTLSSADISIFSSEISIFCYIKKYRYRLHFGIWFLILWTFPLSSKIFLINLIIILIVSAKIATPCLLKMAVFQNKCYDVIIQVDDVTSKFLSRESNYTVDVFMWPKFDNLAFLWEKLSQPQFHKDLTRKTAFLRGGGVLVQV